MPFSAFAACVDTGSLERMYVCGRGEVNDTVRKAFEDIYYEYYAIVGNSDEYVKIYRDYGHKLLKGMLIGCAYTLLAAGMLAGSDTEKMLRRYRIRLDGDTEGMRLMLDSHFAKNSLDLSHCKKRLDDYIKANTSHRKSGMLETLARISDYLGYNISAGSITLAEFCEYHKIIEEKERNRVNNKNTTTNGKRKH